MSYDEPSNSDDLLDSRQIIDAIANMRAILDDPDRADTNNGMIGDDDIDLDYLAALEAFAAEGETLPDWPYGETLIRDSYFQDYARELADDIGAIDSNASWPLTYIDWEAAADALKMDYTSIDFDGVTYWGHS